nr:MAG TPA_asm: hypothetical protein [Caudoviricetes sp.]
MSILAQGFCRNEERRNHPVSNDVDLSLIRDGPTSSPPGYYQSDKAMRCIF